jgi:hypothetical protein
MDAAPAAEDTTAPAGAVGMSRFDKFNSFTRRGQARLARAGCAAAVRLWYTIWAYENAGTDSARVSAGTLAEDYGTDRRNVGRMLAQLEEHGYLITLSTGSKGRGACAVYRLTVPLENASPGRISDEGKCVTRTHISAPNKCVPTTHIGGENASWAPGKCVTTTHEQKEQKKDIPAAVAAGGTEATKAKAPGKVKPPRGRPAKATNPNLARAVEAFVAAWRAKYARDYIFAGGKDAKAIKLVLAAVGNDLDRFRGVVGAYLGSTDKFITDTAHALGVLQMKINAFTSAATPAPPAADPKDAQRAMYARIVADGLMPRAEAEKLHGGPLDDHADAT